MIIKSLVLGALLLGLSDARPSQRFGLLGRRNGGRNRGRPSFAKAKKSKGGRQISAETLTVCQDEIASTCGLDESSLADLIQNLANYETAQEAAKEASTTPVGDGYCDSGSDFIGSTRALSAAACESACGDDDACDFFAFCPATTLTCTGGHKNFCALYTGDCALTSELGEGYVAYEAVLGFITPVPEEPSEDELAMLAQLTEVRACLQGEVKPALELLEDSLEEGDQCLAAINCKKDKKDQTTEEGGGDVIKVEDPEGEVVVEDIAK